jgi:hypothetical protein
MKPTARQPEKIHVAFELQGNEVDRFLKYKGDQFLRTNSEAGRKLLLERLSQIETQQGSESAAQV